MLPLLLILASTSAISNQLPAPQDPNTAIHALLTQQANDWNRGDIEAFARGYKRSPDILFIGPHIRHGYDEMLAGYKTRYASREAMGTLTFTNLDVHPLDARIATTTGNFHLTRSQKGGGNADGYFLLVLEKTSAGWKIICDDTTAAPPPKP
jgi:ketosteroid isomerase-like protein